MARPKKAVKSIEKNISLPEDLVARVDLELWSDLEGKLPFGAWQKYVEGLIRQDLAQRSNGNGGGGSGLPCQTSKFYGAGGNDPY